MMTLLVGHIAQHLSGIAIPQNAGELAAPMNYIGNVMTEAVTGEGGLPRVSFMSPTRTL